MSLNAHPLPVLPEEHTWPPGARMPKGKANNRQTAKSYNVMSGRAQCHEKTIKQVVGQRGMENGHKGDRVLWHARKASEPQVVN